jgi:hypothetical protein
MAEQLEQNRQLQQQCHKQLSGPNQSRLSATKKEHLETTIKKLDSEKTVVMTHWNDVFNG